MPCFRQLPITFMLQDIKISFEDVDFYSKVSLILDTLVRNSTTQRTIKVAFVVVSNPIVAQRETFTSFGMRGWRISGVGCTLKWDKSLQISSRLKGLGERLYGFVLYMHFMPFLSSYCRYFKLFKYRTRAIKGRSFYSKIIF